LFLKGINTILTLKSHRLKYAYAFPFTSFYYETVCLFVDLIESFAVLFMHKSVIQAAVEVLLNAIRCIVIALFVQRLHLLFLCCRKKSNKKSGTFFLSLREKKEAPRRVV
jgi:hypothetical protein